MVGFRVANGYYVRKTPTWLFSWVHWEGKVCVCLGGGGGGVGRRWWNAFTKLLPGENR